MEPSPSAPHLRPVPDLDAKDVERWRQMTPHEKTTLISQLWREADARLTAELRAQFPAATDREIFLRKAIGRLGYDLAVAAFPDAADLEGQWLR